MKHLLALLLKFAMVGLVLAAVLGYMTDLNGRQIFTIALTVTLVAYLLGDLFILPRFNNTIATIADFGLALVTIYAFNWVYRNVNIEFSDALTAAAILGVGEYLFHKYVAKAVLPG